MGKGLPGTNNPPREFFLYSLSMVDFQLLFFTLKVGDELMVEKWVSQLSA